MAMTALTRFLALWCRLTGGHRWRRPWKAEPKDSMICARCGAERPIRKHKERAPKGKP